MGSKLKTPKKVIDLLLCTSHIKKKEGKLPVDSSSPRGSKRLVLSSLPPPATISKASNGRSDNYEVNL